MRFLCVECDEVMVFAEREVPGDGTLTAVFTCGRCAREVAMLANPMETQLVSALGIAIGGRTVPSQPLEQTRASLESPSPPPPSPEPAGAAGARVTWSPEAVERLDRVPRFVRGMVKRIYAEYAGENGIELITPAVMDRARMDLGLEGM